MAKRRPGLWTETAFGLALVTLVAIVLSAGVAGVLFKAAESERRTEMAQRTARVLRAQLEVEALTADPGYQRVLRAYANTVPPDGEICRADNAKPLISSPQRKLTRAREELPECRLRRSLIAG